MNLVSNPGIKTDAAKDKKMTKINVKFTLYSIYYINNKNLAKWEKINYSSYKNT